MLLCFCVGVELLDETANAVWSLTAAGRAWQTLGDTQTNRGGSPMPNGRFILWTALISLASVIGLERYRAAKGK